MLKEFREFAVRGNVVDLAVGVIIGAAFNGIVQSLVADLFMPIISAVSGGLDFSNYFLALSPRVSADTLAEAKKQGAVLAWGNFLTVMLNFVIVAWALFLVVKLINRLRRMADEEPGKAAPAPTRQEALLMEIRDLLRGRADSSARPV
jgi:large conductance mechanosensitive channel